MAEPGLERPPAAADLEAAFAALPAKKEALREAFDRLAACSPYPLPFTWEGLDAHISAIQSSISRRLRQLQVLEATRSARAVPAPAETRSGDNQQEEEEEEEEEEVVVEVEEEESDDEEDKEGEGEEEEEEEEEVEEEDVEEEEVEEDMVEEAEAATMDAGEQEADEDMQLTNEVDRNAKEELEASGKVEEQNADEEMVHKKDKEAKEETTEEVHEEGKEGLEAEKENEPPYIEPGAKNADVSLKEDMTQKQVQRVQAGRSKDLKAACARMDANMLVKLICGNHTALRYMLPIAMRHAPDTAALVLQVVKLFLPSKKLNATKVWNNCISLIRSVPAATSKPSADTIDQAKQVAKDWKEMIYKLECHGDLELLGAWGLLYFLMSYNIVSEFDTSEIIRLFSMIPHHKQNKNTVELCKGLGIADRITDVIDYLIGKGQQLKVLHLANVFNLLDKYPLVSILKGYIETAKQTSMEIQSKSLISAIPKEIGNLWVAHHLAKQISDSSQRGAIMVEIQTLLNGYSRKKKRQFKECTSRSQMQRKKCKKEVQELHKGQENLQKDQQSKAKEQEHQQNNPQQKQQKHESQVRENDQQQQKSRPQEVQPKLKQPTRFTPPVVPLVRNVAQIGHFGHPPYSAVVPNVAQAGHFGRPPYSDVPGVRPVFGLPPGAAQYIWSFNPFFPHPQFYPRLQLLSPVAQLLSQMQIRQGIMDSKGN